MNPGAALFKSIYGAVSAPPAEPVRNTRPPVSLIANRPLPSPTDWISCGAPFGTVVNGVSRTVMPDAVIGAIGSASAVSGSCGPASAGLGPSARDSTNIANAGQQKCCMVPLLVSTAAEISSSAIITRPIAPLGKQAGFGHHWRTC